MISGLRGSISFLLSDIKVHGTRPDLGSTASAESQDFPQLTGCYSDIIGQDIEYWE